MELAKSLHLPAPRAPLARLHARTIQHAEPEDKPRGGARHASSRETKGGATGTVGMVERGTPAHFSLKVQRLHRLHSLHCLHSLHHVQRLVPSLRLVPIVHRHCLHLATTSTGPTTASRRRSGGVLIGRSSVAGLALHAPGAVPRRAAAPSEAASKAEARAGSPGVEGFGTRAQGGVAQVHRIARVAAAALGPTTPRDPRDSPSSLGPTTPLDRARPRSERPKCDGRSLHPFAQAAAGCRSL